MITFLADFIRDIVVLTIGVFFGQVFYTLYLINLYADRVKEFTYM